MSKLKSILKNDLGWKVFGTWMLSFIVPIFLFGLVLFIQYGDNIITVFKSGFDIWQRSGYMSIEKINREINLWTLDEPKFQDHKILDDKLEVLFDDHSTSSLIVERKGDEVTSLIPLSEKEKSELQTAFSKLDEQILPEFGAEDVFNNEELLEKTGYVLYRQIDFYYADGEEGSIYLFIKYSNVPYKVMRVIGDNILYVTIIMLGINALISLYMIKRMAKPFNNLLNAMKRYKVNDFTPRLEESEKHRMVNVINSAVNDMASELQVSQEKSIKMEASRREFVAKISHDTKTPLASIRAHTEAIRDGLITDDEKRIKYTENILKKVHALDHMINELSLYSELEVGLNQYSFSKVNLGYYLEDILEELQYDLDKNKVKLNFHNLLSEEISIYLDVNRFQRVMINLINNSVRYGQREQLMIDVTVKSHEGFAKIYVRDNGIGLTIDDPHVLLTSFVRGEASRDPNNSGSGLGLAIAKSIINKHEGDITINTEAGVYFEVCMTLPLEGGYFEENIDN
ncbi:MAG: HAMP domain-containing histidine kinase [Clostridiales bacterium]|nr:HAMP domain-containing histidine kinase [Clostridiales bacterium]